MKKIKRYMAKTLDYFNLLNPINKPFILMYHRVIEPSSLDYIELPGMYVSIETFKMHVSLLKDKYSIVPLNKLLEAYNNGEELKNVCSITFDDGWFDNYLNVFPIINRNKFPISIFLSTNLINTNTSLWAEEICLFLSQRENLSLFKESFNSREANFLKSLFGNTMLTPEDITNHIDAIKRLEPGDREVLVGKVISINKKNSEYKREILNWEEIIEMKKSGYVDFYPHGHNHLFLPELKTDELSFEVEESIRQIKSNIPDQEINIFCYPSGRYSDKAIECLKRNNIEYGLYRTGGYLKKNCNNYCIPRIPVHNDISDSRALFKYHLTRQQR